MDIRQLEKTVMKIIGNGSLRRLVLAAALSTGLGFGAHASAYNGSYLIDLNTRTATSLGNVHAGGINDTGQVVGWSSIATGESHAFITGPNGVGMTDLGTLGGLGSGATGINATGQVVGTSYTSAGERHLFLTGPNGAGMTDLGTLGGVYGSATGINDAGQVTGWLDTAAGYRAFITGPNGVGMDDLNSLVNLPAGVVLERALAINNMGQVVALASIVPEPESYALMLAGLALIGVMVRRKQKS